MHSSHTELFIQWLIGNAPWTVQTREKYARNLDLGIWESLPLTDFIIDYLKIQDPKAIQTYYLYYRLDQSGIPYYDEKLDLGRHDLKLLWKCFFDAFGSDESQFFGRMVCIPQSRWNSFPVFGSIHTATGNRTKDGLHYHILRTILSLMKNDQELLCLSKKNLSVLLKEKSRDVSDMCMRIAEFARLLRDQLSDQASFHGSLQQKYLLQFISLEPSECLPSKSGKTNFLTYAGFSSDRLYGYIVDTLISLVMVTIDGEQDCNRPLAAVPEDDRELLAMLIFAPFQRLGRITERFLLKESDDDTISFVLPILTDFLCKGVLWIDHNDKQLILKLTPCYNLFVIHNETPRPQGLWKKLATSQTVLSDVKILFDFLRSLANQVCRKQMDIIRTCEPEDWVNHSVFSLCPELEFLLSAAPEDSHHIYTHLTSLLRMQNACHLARIMSHDIDSVIASCDRIHSMGERWPNLVKPQIFLTDRYPVKGDCSNLSYLLHRIKCTRLLEELQIREVFPVETLLKYAIIAENSIQSCIRYAEEYGSVSDRIRFYHLFIDVKVLQAEAVLASENTDRESFIMDYAVPSWKTLYHAARSYMSLMAAEMRRGRRPLESSDVQSAYQEICVAAGTYQNALLESDAGQKILSPQDHRLLSFHPDKDIDLLVEQFREIEGLSTFAASTIKDKDVPHVWIPKSLPHREFHQSWFLSDLDSVAMVKEDDASRAQFHIMTHLLSGQNIVMTMNQLIDNRLIRHLSHNPAFLWALKMGRVSLSLYGNSYSIVSHAAELMNKTHQAERRGEIKNAFRWSSLPTEFDQDETSRREAAQYLTGKISRQDISSEFKDLILQFADELTILDETIPYQTRLMHYQRGKPPIMIDILNKNYQWLSQAEEHSQLCQLHNRFCNVLGPNPFRTDYQRLIDLCKNGKDEGLTPTEKLLLQDVECFPEKEALLDRSEFLLNDSYNRMLAGTFTSCVEFSYSNADRKLIRHDDSRALREGGCRLYHQETKITETGNAIDWNGLIDRIIQQDMIIRQFPSITPSELADTIGFGDDINYQIEVKNDEEILRVQKIHLRGDFRDRKKVLVEVVNTSDRVYMETQWKE